jgi:4-amino-4-deoxy-L-arabinose transferase-like glycosyltransferase
MNELSLPPNAGAVSTKMPASSHARALILLLAAGLLLRLGAAYLARDMIYISDQAERIYAAQSLVHGHGIRYAQPKWDSAHWGPLYVLLLAAHVRLFKNFLPWFCLTQTLLSVLTAYLLYRVGRKAFDERTALAACGVFLFYPTAIAFTHHILDENLSVLFCLAVPFLALQMRSRWDNLYAILTGVFVGLSGLVRSSFLVLLPILFVFFYFASGKKVRKTAVACLLVLGFTLLTLSPWLLRNYAEFGDFPLLDTTAGDAMWQGNNGFQPMVWDWGFRNTEEAEYPIWERSRSADPKEAQAENMRKGIAFMARYPALTLKRIPFRAAAFLLPSSPLAFAAHTGMYPRLSRWQIGLLALLTAIPFMAIVLAGVAGLVFAENNLFKFYALSFILFLFALHSLVLTCTRYRFPLEPFLMLYGAYWVVHWRPIGKGRAFLRRLPWLIAIWAAIALMWRENWGRVFDKF